MKRQTKDLQKKLAHDSETIRTLSVQALTQVQGGFSSDDQCTNKKSGCATIP
jgi:hypothetical protein